MIIGQQIHRAILVGELLVHLQKLGVDWSDITGTDSADPTSVEPPTDGEIKLVQDFLRSHNIICT